MGYADSEILKAIRSGDDKDVLQYMYEKHFPKMRKYVMNNSGDSDAAFDIFQDSMVVFYKYVREGRFNPEHETGAFLFSVGRNLWLNRVKKEKREVAMAEHVDFMDEGQDVISLLITREREELISGILKELGEKCKKLLQLSVFYRMRNSEICERMGFSTENAVKTRKYKCMQKLISIVEERPSLKKALRE